MTTEVLQDAMFSTDQIKALHEAHILNTYGARKLSLVRGEGCTVWDAEGNEYLDCMAGIAVASLGHCHPDVTDAIVRQAQTLVHTSNLYYIQQQGELAALLCKHSFAQKWFFANCGATANEAAIKLARRYWAQQGTPRPTIVTMNQSFHGRTLATITATAQPKYQEGFEPLVPGFKHVEYNDLDALERALTPDVGAILVEPIQGEGGVRVPDGGYFRGVRALCDKANVLLLLDEVQVGMGRTGKLFCHEHDEIAPDVITLAKALGNGVPIGAMGCTDKVASGFSVGSHASTFGGNPLSTAAALATLKVMVQPGFLDAVTQTGNHFKLGLQSLASKHAQIVDVRGKGLILGMELNAPVAPVVQAMLQKNIIIGNAGPNTLRFVPPLIISTDAVDRVIETLDQVLGTL
ncbi:MAG: acetylornithine aminotransferase [Candidatus Hydrogenedentota bacterium]